MDHLLLRPDKADIDRVAWNALRRVRHHFEALVAKAALPECPEFRRRDIGKRDPGAEQGRQPDHRASPKASLAHALAMAGRYDEAISVLTLAANKQDPRILNYLGYSHRHSGRITVGLGYYEEALRINPDYTLVREYLGEAHLQIGDLAGAREQLSEIEKRTGKGSREYGMRGRNSSLSR